MTCWERDDKQAFFSIYELPWEPDAETGLFEGLSRRMVSRNPAMGSFTALVQLPAGWQASAGGQPATIELFVVEGEVEVEGSRLPVGGYAFLPENGTRASLGSPAGATAYLFWTPEMPLGSAADVPSREVRLASFWDEPWQEGLLDRKLPQRWKSLRLPDADEGAHGGPAGLLRVMQWLPGFVAPKEHVHSVWEEMLFLSGDWLDYKRGSLAAGSYLGNPAGYWHAPCAVHDSALAIVHTDAALDLDQREISDGQAFTRAYLERASWLELPRHRGPEAFEQLGIAEV